MKRLIPTTFLLIFIILTCFLGNKIAIMECEKTKEELLLCKELMETGDFTAAKKASQDIYEKWHKRKRLLSAFVNHGLLDETNGALSRLQSYALFGKRDLFLSEYYYTNNILDQITHEQRLTAESFY